MPFANLKVPAGTLTTESKKKLQDAVTDGGWSLGGTILNEAMLGRV